MIQFNLLPNVKLQYIKLQRTKRLVIIISLALASASLALLIVMVLTVQVAQKKHITDVGKDITTQVASLKKVKDLDKILTIQNQLNSLPALHEKKPVTSRVFSYISQLTPATASIANLTIDFTLNTVTISGTAESLTVANQYADTLKFATYKVDGKEGGRPFTNVVTSLSRDTKLTTFVLTASFDPVLFEGSASPVLTVPSIISTRSETEKPTLFKENEVTK